MEQTFEVPMIKKEKFKKLNLKTNRMKTSRKTRLLVTDIEPSNRNFKNLPRYANDKPKVRFQDWLLIKGEKISPNHSVNSFVNPKPIGRLGGVGHTARFMDLK